MDRYDIQIADPEKLALSAKADYVATLLIGLGVHRGELGLGVNNSQEK